MQNTQVPKQRDPKANFGCSHAAHKDSEITNQALAGRRVRYLALETFDYLYAHPRHVQCLWDLVGRNWVVVVCVPARRHAKDIDLVSYPGMRPTCACPGTDPTAKFIPQCSREGRKPSGSFGVGFRSLKQDPSWTEATAICEVDETLERAALMLISYRSLIIPSQNPDVDRDTPLEESSSLHMTQVPRPTEPPPFADKVTRHSKPPNSRGVEIQGKRYSPMQKTPQPSVQTTERRSLVSPDSIS